MIAQGTLNKTVDIQRLTRKKDEYFADIEEWQTVFSARANVKDYSERDYREIINDAVIVTDRLTFTMRKYVCKYLALDYRIIHRCKAYKILSISDELPDRVVVLTELINE